ncbi:zinc metallopeptidase [Pyrococcus furiosus DSM 3638]|uniref:Zinc metallopeptidase n=3 Tax=Pyrococcus furiosus TaxID=2261 RepID=A0A5C0XWQ2_PYRFU|nr:M48 family metallopeptidase [Pyrococcus furiosus]AAL81721.1 heat shock protein x [Pyrococcus furiosus DSM 3638]AFN04379.1 heat shock protein x [Pyrococcus furiosus COM1]QEK79220.1 zinc metallopeptidase [Pyrococcus furiosus DSM 3638]
MLLLWAIFLLHIVINLVTFGVLRGLFITMLSLLLAFLMYKISLKINLPVKRYSKIQWEDIPWLYDGIARMANRAKIPMPNIYIEDNPLPAAYSFENSIVISAGLLDILNEDEVLAVAAHEIGHLKNGDTVIFPLAKYYKYIMGGTTILTMALIESKHIKFLAGLVYLAYVLLLNKFFRSREFKADHVALRIAEVPYALKTALEELKYYEETISGRLPLPTIRPSVERKEEQRQYWAFVSTHPSYDERIAKIMAIVEMYRSLEI